MKKKIALILGITGQDGSFIAELLLKKNYSVHGYVRKSATGNLKNIKNLINQNKIQIHHGDILDYSSLNRVFNSVKPDEIYNFADQDHVRWSAELPIYSFDVTGSSLIKILEIIKTSLPKTKYFHPFSSNVFGNSKKAKLDENENFSPLSIYALGKVTAYHACKIYRDVHKLKIYGAIFFNHESERRPEEYVTRKITKSVAKIYHKKQKKLKLGDVSAKIDWGYAQDYVEAAYRIMQKKKPNFYIIGTGKKTSVIEFVKKCFSYVKLDYKKFLIVDKKLFRKGATKTLVANANKAKREINFKVKTDINKLIKIMMDNDLESERN
jgi:GDPmannose 4,6-dehydratase